MNIAFIFSDMSCDVIHHSRAHIMGYYFICQKKLCCFLYPKISLAYFNPRLGCKTIQKQIIYTARLLAYLCGNKVMCISGQYNTDELILICRVMYLCTLAYYTAHSH